MMDIDSKLKILHECMGNKGNINVSPWMQARWDCSKSMF
jgi:hypothetical protein